MSMQSRYGCAVNDRQARQQQHHEQQQKTRCCGRRPAAAPAGLDMVLPVLGVLGVLLHARGRAQ